MRFALYGEFLVLSSGRLRLELAVTRFFYDRLFTGRLDLPFLDRRGLELATDSWLRRDFFAEVDST